VTRRALAVLAFLLPAACTHMRPQAARPQVQAPPVPQFASRGAPGPQQTFRGRFSIGFERSTFDGCWLDQRRYWGTFETPPAGSGGVAVYEIEFVGRRTDMIVPPGAELRFQGFGHMGLYRCEYELIELISKQRVE
jgi:hypothetical protein